MQTRNWKNKSVYWKTYRITVEANKIIMNIDSGVHSNSEDGTNMNEDYE